MTSLRSYLEQFPLNRSTPICLVLSESNFRPGGNMDMASLRHTKRDWELADKVILVSNESRKSNNSDSVICILKNKGVRNTDYDYVYRPDILDYDLNNGH